MASFAFLPLLPTLAFLPPRKSGDGKDHHAIAAERIVYTGAMFLPSATAAWSKEEKEEKTEEGDD